MRHLRSLVVAAIALALLSTGPAAAHDVPARRTVTVETSPDRAAILIRWTSARGPQGAQLLARASWGRAKRATRALRALCAAEALRGLDLRLNEAVLKARPKIKVRVRLGDKNAPPRITCAILIDLPIAKQSSLSVKPASGPATKLRWSGPATSNLAASQWYSRRTLRLAWK